MENALFWKNKRLVFHDEPLAEVVKVLNEVLGDSIVIGSESVRNCPLTTTFENPSIASVLDVIKATFNLEVAHVQDHYEIKGAGCN